MDSYRYLERFLTESRIRELGDLVERSAGLFADVGSPLGLGPRYKVINGEQVRRHLPEIVSYGDIELRPVVDAFAGGACPVNGQPAAAIHVQLYERKQHGFRWHFDGHSYAALLTLKDTNRGQTQLINSQLSRWLRLALYPLYAFPGVFSVFPSTKLAMNAGDLLMIRGSRVLHRGAILDESGERRLLIFNYDEMSRQVNPLRDRIARAINY